MHLVPGSTLRCLLAASALLLWLVPGAAFAGDAAAGKALFAGMGTCWTCHGAEGTGDGPASAALDPKPRNLQEGVFAYDANGDGTVGDDEDLALVIKNGPAEYGGSNAMPYFKHLNDTQISDLVAFIRSLKK
ncbi:MAG: cytochrome c [Myxococcota bacterium]|nr:cytochrome c [Myxococcota bacterium]